MSVTLAHAEFWMRNAATDQHKTGTDTPKAFAVVVDEYDRRHAKLAAIHAMLPRLREHLPPQLFAELAAHIYVLPPKALTAADVRRGQEVAAEIEAGDPS